ncbi:MAG: shikimate dehydrogenase [Bacteroidota bacterium]
MENGKELFGLIGFPLAHSLSAEYFNEKFRNEGHYEKEYQLFPLSNIDDFPALLRNHPKLSGVNVTIPYKEKIIPYLDDLNETACQIGAVNTIKIIRENEKIHTIGFNTDAGGFLKTLTDQIPRGKALILGTGGASKAVAWALKKSDIRFSFVSRTNKGPGIISYDELTVEIVQNNKLIINTTPLGMYPDTEQFPPLPYDGLTKDHFLYDLIYNPEETRFIKIGRAMNVPTMNGKQMLINQAELAYEIFRAKEDFFPYSQVRHP